LNTCSLSSRPARPQIAVECGARVRFLESTPAAQAGSGNGQVCRLPFSIAHDTMLRRVAINQVRS
ncbi:MAG: hypothetical protein V3T61_00640, partial [Acidobacteriota bacterium]